jgi:hypothetical protein
MPTIKATTPQETLEALRAVLAVRVAEEEAKHNTLLAQRYTYGSRIKNRSVRISCAHLNGLRDALVLLNKTTLEEDQDG